MSRVAEQEVAVCQDMGHSCEEGNLDAWEWPYKEVQGETEKVQERRPGAEVMLRLQ